MAGYAHVREPGRFLLAHCGGWSADEPLACLGTFGKTEQSGR
jgi:hypothetical protein